MLNQPKTITESDRLLPTKMVMMLAGLALLADSGTVATP
jgi:predicted benzoate:H+ symporter BenE